MDRQLDEFKIFEEVVFELKIVLPSFIAKTAIWINPQVFRYVS